jgi:hypothetical protein
VPEQFLHRADVIARDQQMGRETVPQPMRRDRFRETCGARGACNCALHDLLVQMMTPVHAMCRIDGAAARQKDVLPDPAAPGFRILARQREGHVHFAEALGEIAFVQRPHPGQVRAQRLDQALGEHRHAITRAPRFQSTPLAHAAAAWRAPRLPSTAA